MTNDRRCPVTVLTGFLGGGKTTLLNRSLQDPALSRVMVIVNEFGDAGLDHLLVETTTENVRILDNGCLCCTVRGDLVDTLVTLRQFRLRGALDFDRVVIETSGMADPLPVLHALQADEAVLADWRLAGVVVAIDATNGIETLRAYVEAARQLGSADRIVLTKADIAAPGRVEATQTAVRQINRDALFDVHDLTRHAPRWFDENLNPFLKRERFFAHDVATNHTPRVSTCDFVLEKPAIRENLEEWLELVAAMRGNFLLRVKGIVALADLPDSEVAVVNIVQHVMYPMTIRPRPAGLDRYGHVTFIVQDMDMSVIERSAARFLKTGGKVIKPIG